LSNQASPIDGSSFKGQLGAFSLGDIFQSLSLNRQSGTLSIDDGSRQKKIYFAEGSITLLSSSRRVRLGEMLVSTGKISEEDLDLAIRLQRQNRKLLGQILVDEGFCDQADINRILRYQIEGEIYDLFLWKTASFEFIAGAMPPEMREATPNLTQLELNVASLLIEALRRLDEWNQLVHLVPSTKDVLVGTDKSQSLWGEAPARLRDHAALFDGKTNVEGLAEKLVTTEFELCKILAEAVQKELIRCLTPEELVASAESAYALNDFETAAVLFARLNELYPTEIKVQFPFADSLRRANREEAALAMYERILQTLSPDQDLGKLKRCCQAIVQLDPERADVIQHLHDLEELEKRRKRPKGLVPMILIAVVLVGGAWGFLIFKAAEKKKAEDTKQAEQSQAALKKRIKIFQVLMAENKFREAHQSGLAILAEINEESASALIDEVRLPILVHSAPAGYLVEINDIPFGRTQPGRAVLGKYDPRKGPVTVTLKRKEDDDSPVWVKPLIDESVFHELRASIASDPVWNWVGDAPVHAPISWSEELSSYVAASRDGRLLVVDGGGQLTRSFQVGEFGDVLSGIAVSGGKAYLGRSAGGVAAFKLSEKSAKPRIFAASGPVSATPMLAGGRIAFGSYDCYVYLYDLSGKLVAKERGIGPYRYPGALVSKGLGIVFAGDDKRIVRLTLSSGKVGDGLELPAAPASPFLRLKDGFLLLLSDGRVVGIDDAVSALSDRFKLSLLPPFSAACTETTLIVGSGSEVHAFELASGKKLWQRKFEASSSRVRLAMLGDRVLVSTGGVLILMLDARSGLLRWQGRLPKGHAVASPLSVIKGDLIVGLDGLSTLKFTPKVP